MSPRPRPPQAALGETGRRFWRDTLRDYGIADAAGLELLAQAAKSLDLVEECRRRIARDGLITPGSRPGTVRPHPLLAVQAESRRAFIAAVRCLNLDISPDEEGRHHHADS